jgi:hypothetical protein
MQLSKISPTKYKMTLHSYELATLISAVRWIAEGAKGTISPEIIEQMENILNSYENAIDHLNKS